MTTDQSELMDCPFCGGHIINFTAYGGSYQVGCAVCEIHTSEEYLTRQQAIEKWNRRPTPTIAGDRGEAFQWVTNNKKAIIPLLSDPKISDESRKIYQHCLSVYETLLSALATPPETIPADDLKTVREALDRLQQVMVKTATLISKPAGHPEYPQDYSMNIIEDFITVKKMFQRMGKQA